MGYDHYFHFIKDDLIDPNIAFIQNVDNFLFCIYFNCLERYESDIKKETNILLANLFRNIKSVLMGGIMTLGCKKVDLEEKLKELLEEKDDEKREDKLFSTYLDFKLSFEFPNIMDELIDLKFDCMEMNYAEMQVDLILYCIFVNGLSKTKGEKFDKIKKEMEPLTEILKEIFCEFDKNEIHKERTFIFPLRSPEGSYDDFYIINYKDDLLRKFSDDGDDVKILSLNTSSQKRQEKDKKKNSITVLDGKKVCFSILDGKKVCLSIALDEKDEKDEKKIINFKKIITGIPLKDIKDEREITYYSIVLDESLYDGEEEYKL